jgi:anti-anti-sigma factor
MYNSATPNHGGVGPPRGAAMSTVPVRAGKFKLRSYTTDSETVVLCSGRLTSQDSEEFKEKVRALIPNSKILVVDFTQLEHLDSSGIGAVVMLYVKAKNAGCELRLVNFNQRVRDLLGLTGLLKVFGDCGRYMVKLP